MPLKSERFEMRLDPATLQQVEAWRAEQPDRPSRAEAVRRLVAAGLGLSGKDEVRISGGERLILLLLCHLVDPHSTDLEVDPKFVLEAIYGGHYWALEWEYPSLFHGHVDHREVLTEVIDVLDVWYFMENGYEKLSKEGKKLVEQEGAPFGNPVRFPGFDGNYETEHLSIAKFLVNKMGRFDRFKDRDLNSHLPITHAYRRMLPVFKLIQMNFVGRELSSSEIIDLLQAYRSPSGPTNS